tara:strand:- start:2553 stop:2672 length:120 start_codon:yes stop_codon:yes gene_type:complete
MNTLKKYIKECDGAFCDTVLLIAFSIAVMSVMVLSLAQL